MIGAFAFALLQEVFKSEALWGAFAKHWHLGLGLTIAQRLASALGSSLTVCSRPGRGSVFSLWLSRDAGVT